MQEKKKEWLIITKKREEFLCNFFLKIKGKALNHSHDPVKAI